MNKKQRQAAILRLLKSRPAANQEQLVGLLADAGIATTQASLSRDLNELGIVKVDGAYQLPTLEPGQSQLVRKLSADRAGDHMVVFRTDPGHAPMLASHIDRAKISGLIGTIAGDDTIFVAVADAKEQGRIIKRVMNLVHANRGAEL